MTIASIPEIRRWPDWVANLGAAGVDFFYPPTCPLCRKDVPGNLRRATGGICTDCGPELLPRPAGACDCCGAPLGPNLDPAAGCTFCRGENYVFDRVFRLGVYDGRLRMAVLKSKAKGSEWVAAALAHYLWEERQREILSTGIDGVVAIPQHWMQHLIQPYHAADTLAAVWARSLQVPLHAHILKKVRRTPSQVSLSPHERRSNLRNAFAVKRGDAIAGKTVLLADDVMTTGSTVNEAAKVLLKAGARRVVVAVIARGLGRQAAASPNG